MLALQDLGEQLVGLSPERLARMSLSPELLDALALAARIHAREGRRRQLQYVGRLMRHADAEAIQAELNRELQPSRADTALMHAAERWRETLLEAPERLEELAPEPPPELRAALQAACTEAGRGTRARHYRELYRLIRTYLSERHD